MINTISRDPYGSKKKTDDYKEILDEFFNLNRFHIKLGLSRIKKALDMLDNPQNRFRSIHIAGTNGKGSTCHMVAKILKDAGYTTGLYTSPFLKDFKESITIDENRINETDVIRYYRKIRGIDSDYGLELTYFEVKTIMAFLHFAENKIDFAVIEVGMGGRDDATNVVHPIITAITNVDMDHTNVLGDTIDEIAEIKAGIIKPRIPIIASEDNKGIETIKYIATKNDAPLTIIQDHVTESPTNMLGSFQKKNATLAYHIIKELNEKGYTAIPQNRVNESLMDMHIQGRMQKIDITCNKTKRKRRMLLDCAHNLPAIKLLKEEIKSMKKQGSRIIVLFTALKDKMQEEMIEEMKTVSDRMVLTTIDIVRASRKEELETFKDENTQIMSYPSEALKRCIDISEENDLIVVCGSCYLIGEIKKAIEDSSGYSITDDNC